MVKLKKKLELDHTFPAQHSVAQPFFESLYSELIKIFSD